MPLPCNHDVPTGKELLALRRDFDYEKGSTILFRLALAAEARGETERAERYLYHSSRLDENGE